MEKIIEIKTLFEEKLLGITAEITQLKKDNEMLEESRKHQKKMRENYYKLNK